MCSRKGLNMGPIFDFESGFDMGSARVFEWILWMIDQRRVWVLFWGPPCTTALLARKPGLRGLAAADGLDPLCPKTAEGNLHIYSSLCLAARQAAMGGATCGEQPAFGHFRALGAWRSLALLGEELLFDWCRYGRAWKKTTRLLTVNMPWANSLARRCNCGK